MEKTWETLDNVLHRKTSKSSPDAIQVNDKLSTCVDIICCSLLAQH